MERFVRKILAVAVAGAIGGLCAPLVAGASLATEDGTTELISIDRNGQQSFRATVSSISDDGRFVVFESMADDLILNVGDQVTRQVYLRDRQTSTTTLVSKAMTTGAGNAESFSPQISGDGNWIVFRSQATNLVADSFTASTHVFRASRATGAIQWVDQIVGREATLAQTASISDDGDRIAFTAQGLTAPTIRHAYVRTMSTSTTQRIDVPFSAEETPTESPVATGTVISGNGRYVIFFDPDDALSGVSYANNFSNSPFVYRRDLQTNTTELAWSDSAGVAMPSDSQTAVVSDDGRYVAITTARANMVAGDTVDTDVIVRDLTSGTNALATVNSAGAGQTGASQSVSEQRIAMDDAGRYIAFGSRSTNLDAADTKNDVDLFVHDMVGGSTRLQSKHYDGTADDYGFADAQTPFNPAMNGNGSAVTFYSNSGRMVDGITTGLGANIFMRSVYLPAAPTIIGARTPAANANGWNNEPVVVSFTCGSDALATCTPPVTVSTDGADQSVSGTATDTYAQSTSTSVTGISIDQVPPSIFGLASTSPNGAGWFDLPVTMVWTCEDGLSGITDGVCPSPTTTVGEGSSVLVSASVHDRAGNQASASSESVQIDMTPPSTGVSTPPTSSNGSVTLTLTATDALSGVASTAYIIDGGPTQTGTAPVVSGPGHHTVSYWSTDLAGNQESTSLVGVDIDVNTDTSAPTITSHVSPPPNSNGWHRGSVDVTFTCADADSGVASCTGDESFSDEVDTVVTGQATDGAGNTASTTATVRIDLHAPSVTAQVPAANAHGWFNQAVQAPFSCVDTGGSGVDVCPAAAVFAGEGANQAVTGTGRDNAGNEGSASGSSVSIDLTPPTISGEAINGSNGNGGHYGNVTIRWTCDDLLSGPVSCPADQVVSGEGVHTVSGSVTDRAGNTSSAEVTIRIDHDPSTDPGIVHGVASDASTGLAAANVQVRLHNPTTQATLYTTYSGTDGTYTFPTVNDGSYVLSFTKSGTFLQAFYPNAAGFLQGTPIVVAHGTNRTADQALTPGYALTGVITSAAGGAPVSGATVRVQGGIEYSAVTDAAGRYTISGLPAGSSRTISVVAYGYVPFSQAAAWPGTTTLNKALTPAGASPGFKGTITSLTPGGPLAGATVRVWVKGASTFGLTATTGADGRFTFPSLPAGDYEVDVVRGSYQVRWFGDVLSRSGAATARVTGSCTTTPDTTWGDPCLKPVNIQMRTP